eukprot:4056158-Amphidinium_carterae.1
MERKARGAAAPSQDSPWNVKKPRVWRAAALMSVWELLLARAATRLVLVMIMLLAADRLPELAVCRLVADLTKVPPPTALAVGRPADLLWWLSSLVIESIHHLLQFVDMYLLRLLRRHYV